MSTEEEDDFEDAVEALQDETIVQSSTMAAPIAAMRPGPSTGPSPPSTPSRPSSMFPPANGGGIPTPHTGMHADSAMSARQERLKALRSRLRDEFGAMPKCINNGEFSDTLSVTSDTASLHSWHHNLLAGAGSTIVRPVDSMSTCAVVPSQFSPLSPSSGPPASPAPRLLSPTGGAPGTPNRLPPPLPPRPPSIRLPDPVATEVLARIAAAERLHHESTESPTESVCERTLIGGSMASPSIVSNASTIVSPTGRPRSKSTKEDLWRGVEGVGGVPAVASSPAVVQPLEEEDEDEPTPRERPGSIKARSAQSSAESVGGTVEKGEGGGSAGALSSHSTSAGLPPTSAERRRGHAKTNSLDRGLTLAKSIKTGPFPPPSSKSNSLTRGAPPPNGFEEGEEDERNTMANQVIAALTTSVIGEEPAAMAHVEEAPQRPSQLGAIPSCSTSSASSSVSSTEGRRSHHRRDDGKRGDEKETKGGRGGMRDRDALSVVNESPEHTHPEGRASGLTVGLGLIGRTVTVEADDDPETSAARIHSRLRLSPTDADASYDPITRDVERRMSMKGHNSLGSEGGARERSEDSHSIAGSTLSHAGSAVKEIASGIFRGMISRARSALHSGGANNKAVPESDLSESDSEMDEPSMADSVSVAGRSTTPQAGIVRPRKAKKGPFDFADLRVVQEISNEHTGSIWCVKFSICGRLMATAGQDAIVRVWCVRSALKYFTDMRERYQQKRGSASSSVGSFDAFERTMADLDSDLASSIKPPSSSGSVDGGSSEDGDPTLFAAKPFVIFKGHTADVLDLSWSKNYFVLSSGMDRTVKLWHLSRSECLCCFTHLDFVTCVSFLPKDDRYFLSGSLDGKLRMWHIPDKKVAVWNEVGVKFITALTFAKSGKFVVIGTYNGKCYFYSTDQLKYHTVIDVRSQRGKNARGHKVTGLSVHGDKLLVTSNDSRIRMYDLRDKSISCKFKGAQNERSQIRAAFSPDGKHIVCGSEDRFVYIWRTGDLPTSLSVRKDRNAQWERVRTHDVPVSVACFAPKPALFIHALARMESAKRKGADAYRSASAAAWAAEHSVASLLPQGDVIISADLNGCIKVMVNRAKPVKTGQSTFFSTSREI